MLPYHVLTDTVTIWNRMGGDSSAAETYRKTIVNRVRGRVVRSSTARISGEAGRDEMTLYYSMEHSAPDGAAYVPGELFTGAANTFTIRKHIDFMELGESDSDTPGLGAFRMGTVEVKGAPGERSYVKVRSE